MLTNWDLPYIHQAILQKQRDNLLKKFSYDHLPPHLAEVSRPFHDLAQLVGELPLCEESIVGLRKLLEAKDCAVRATLVAR